MLQVVSSFNRVPAHQLRDLKFTSGELEESINTAPSTPAAETAEQTWSNTSSGCISNISKASTSFAQRLVELSDSVYPIGETSSIIDIGAGTGEVTVSVALRHTDCNIAAVNISPDMFEVIDEFNDSNTRTKPIDVIDRSIAAHNKYTHAFSSFMLQTTTTPMEVLKNLHARLEDDGVMSLAVWGPLVDPEEIWEKACKTLDPSFALAPTFDDPNIWRTTEQLKEHIQSAGFTDVVVEHVNTSFEFDSTAEFMEFWFNSKNPGTLAVISQWKGDMRLAGEATRRVCAEQYDSGKKLPIQASLGVGRKFV